MTHNKELDALIDKLPSNLAINLRTLADASKTNGVNSEYLRKYHKISPQSITAITKHYEEWLKQGDVRFLSKDFRNMFELFLTENDYTPASMIPIQLGIDSRVIKELLHYLIEKGFAKRYELFPLGITSLCQASIVSNIQLVFPGIEKRLFANHTQRSKAIVSEYLYKEGMYDGDLLILCSSYSKILDAMKHQSKISSKCEPAVSSALDVITLEPISLKYSLVVNTGKRSRFPPDRIGLHTYWKIKGGLNVSAVDKFVWNPPAEDVFGLTKLMSE